MQLIGTIIHYVLWIFLVLLIVRLIVEWIQVFARSWVPKGIALVLLEAVFTVTDPPIVSLRRVLKPIRFGGIALDLSFLVVILICYLLLFVNQLVFFR